MLYSFRKRIEFIDLSNYNKKVATKTIRGKQQIELICTSSFRTLWYMCLSSGKWSGRRLIQLDCRSSPPQVKSTIEINKYGSLYRDMCFLDSGNKAMVVVAQSYKGLTAYNTETGQIEWMFTVCLKNGKFHPVSHSPNTNGCTSDVYFSSVAADGRGHVFAGGLYNGRVHVLASDGKYLCYINGGRRLNLELVHDVQWCKKTSSLIVSHAEETRMRGVITYVNVK